jgi:hypothetical protein
VGHASRSADRPRRPGGRGHFERNDRGYPGGERHTGTFEEVEAFDIAGGTWSSLPPLPTPRHGLGVAGVGLVVFVIDGGTEPGLSVTNLNEAVDLGSL